MPKFSIITPVNLWNIERVDKFLVTIESVKNQTFKDFEWIVVDDGSSESFLWDQLVVKEIPLLTIIHKDHEERVIALNAGMEVAKGDWFIFLDSDDELAPDALEILSKYIDKNRGQHWMFNYGAIYKHIDGKVTKRAPFKPKWMGKKYGHEVFGGGNIVNGTFIFHKRVYKKLGGYPPRYIEEIDCEPINYGGKRDLLMNSPFNFAAYAQIEFPELRQFFMVDHVNEPQKIIKELGNPWGNDFYIFYKYTRKYQSRAIEEYLYIVHPRN